MPKRHSEKYTHNYYTNDNLEVSSSSSATINSDCSKERLDSLEEKLNRLFSLVNRFMEQLMNSSKNSRDTEDEDKEERYDTDSAPTDYQLSEILLGQYNS
ncbi:hypothetical protein ACTFIU_002117 [Dictyostelium citrinum]